MSKLEGTNLPDFFSCKSPLNNMVEEIQSITARLEAAEKENARLKQSVSKYQASANPSERLVFQLRTTVTEQAAQIEELRKDAERYRWLKWQHEELNSSWAVRDKDMRIPNNLDAAIDSAMEVKS